MILAPPDVNSHQRTGGVTDPILGLGTATLPSEEVGSDSSGVAACGATGKYDALVAIPEVKRGMLVPMDGTAGAPLLPITNSVDALRQRGGGGNAAGHGRATFATTSGPCSSDARTRRP
jgi:hypothetical protein